MHDVDELARQWMTAPYGERVSDLDGWFGNDDPEDDEDAVDLELEFRGFD